MKALLATLGTVILLAASAPQVAFAGSTGPRIIAGSNGQQVIYCQHFYYGYYGLANNVQVTGFNQDNKYYVNQPFTLYPSIPPTCTGIQGWWWVNNIRIYWRNGSNQMAATTCNVPVYGNDWTYCWLN